MTSDSGCATRSSASSSTALPKTRMEPCERNGCVMSLCLPLLRAAAVEPVQTQAPHRIRIETAASRKALASSPEARSFPSHSIDAARTSTTSSYRPGPKGSEAERLGIDERIDERIHTRT